MPRQIIDTESGRPAYRRRVILRWIVAVVLIAVALAAAFELWQSTRPRLTTGAAAAQGKVAQVLQTTVRFPRSRRMYAT
jgi:predicted negative regulator of RcsB-dependent stress response